MAHASRNVRKLRRIKRERSLAFRMAEMALKQRDHARAVANQLATELQNIEAEKEQNAKQELPSGP